MPRPSYLLCVFAALLGGAGVVIAALSAHGDGGELGRTAAQFLILHAGVVLAVCAHARSADPSTARGLLIAAGALGLGTLLFAADLTARAFAGGRLFPFAAPTGGSLMILAWVALAIVFAVGAIREEG